MSLIPFALVEWQALHERSSVYGLADSGCRPSRIVDVVSDPDELVRLFSMEQSYGDLAGSEVLREHIASWHGAQASDVLVTVGGTEANSIVLDSVVENGDHAIFISPGYPQLLGCLRNRGARVDTVALEEEFGWRLSIDQLKRAIRPNTRTIVVTNPNNPTGAVLSKPEVEALITAAAEVGAWLVVDEVHRGTEFDDEITSSLWGQYDRVVCIGSMSKAFALPGLRIGWVISPPTLRDEIQRRHHYATIAPAKLSTAVAELAFVPLVRKQLLNQTRGFIRTGRTELQAWIDASDGLVSVVKPCATASAFVRYRPRAGSLEIAEAIRRAGVLVIPGAHFGVENHLRITHALDPSYLNGALLRISKVLQGFERAA